MFIFMKNIIVFILIISIVSSSFLFVSASSDDKGYIYLFDNKGSNALDIYVIDDFSRFQFVEIDFCFVRDESINFTESQFVNQINITVFWRDETGALYSKNSFLRADSYKVDGIYGIDPCFSNSPYQDIPLYDCSLDYFGFENYIFDTLPAYHFRDIITAFVETQNTFDRNYFKKYSYDDFPSGFSYYSQTYWRDDFSTGNILNFYQTSCVRDPYYNLYDGSEKIATFGFLPGFNAITFEDNEIYNINYIRNIDLVGVHVINFALLNDFNNPFVGVSYTLNSSTYTPFEEYYYKKYSSFYSLPSSVDNFFDDFFIEGFSLYLVDSKDGAVPGSPDLTPEEQEKIKQELKEKEDLQRAVNETSWLNNTVQSTFRKETLYNNAIKDFGSLNKPTFNKNDFTIDDSSRADLYNFAGLYASVFNLDIVNSMLLFGFILAFISYVLFGKKG